jgi:uncharacterized membrane protein YeaQ/YmgE (transglycosylase-associated protein family)
LSHPQNFASEVFVAKIVVTGKLVWSKNFMDISNILVWVIVGGIAGWLASIVMKTNRSQGLLMDIIVGIVGGFIGGWLLTALGVGGGVTGINLGSILTAVVGAVVLLALLRVLRRA